MKITIKSILVLLIAFTIGFYFFSCDGDNDGGKDPETALTVSLTSLDYIADGGFKVINIRADSNISWTISNSTDWCTLSATSGNGNKNVNVEATENDSEKERFTTIIVSDGSTSINIAISQEGSVIPLFVSPTEIEFTKTGGVQEFVITASETTTWEITEITSWLTLSNTTGTGIQTVTATVGDNTENDSRTVTLKINTTSESVELNVSQSYDGIYPNYNINQIPEDNTGMTSTATQIAAQINLGWNLGNSLEAIGGETAWGNPKATKELIDLVKANGFNAIRIPASWNQYSNGDTAKIDEEWLDRVKEVIQYCTDNDMYALLNIHWDSGWLEENCTTDKQVENNAKQKAFWQQIATHLRDFDEHLLFASANEPHVDDAIEMAVLDSYHQTFVDAVRSTGGKNAFRTLVVQGPSTDIQKTYDLMNTLPTDSATDRMMAEIHYYTPWQFAGLTEDASWGTMFYYWGEDYHSTTDTSRNVTWGQEDFLDEAFASMKTKFVDQGIPVILGEFGPMRRTNLTGNDLELHLASRAYHMKYVVQQAKVNGILPFYWDNGGLGVHSSGLFDRSDNTVFDQQVLTALQNGVN